MMFVNQSNLHLHKISIGDIRCINMFMKKNGKIYKRHAFSSKDLRHFLQMKATTFHYFLGDRQDHHSIVVKPNNFGQYGTQLFNTCKRIKFLSVQYLYNYLPNLIKNSKDGNKYKASNLRAFIYDNYRVHGSKQLYISSNYHNKRISTLTVKQRKFLNEYFQTNNADKSCIDVYSGVINRPMERHILNLKKSKKYLKDLSNKRLTPKQKRFCHYYAKWLNATRSYMATYHSSYAVARADGSRLLSTPKVKSMIHKITSNNDVIQNSHIYKPRHLSRWSYLKAFFMGGIK